MGKKEVNGLTGDLTIKGDDAAARTITVGQKGTFQDIVVIGGQLRVSDGLLFDVLAYGAKGDGTTDDSTAVAAAISAAAVNGGTVFFPAGTYLLASTLSIPNDGEAVPAQQPLRLTGACSHFNSNRLTGPAAGSVLKLTSVDAVAKLDTRGYGRLEIDNLSFLDDTDGTSNFIQSTNTTVHIHDCAFWGKTANSGVQDAIVLGGADQTIGGGGAGQGFQGYGTVVENCYFSRIRRAVYCRTTSNSVVIQNNCVWTDCGGVAAIEVAGPGAGAFPNSTGGVIANNLIEMPNYTYGVKLANATYWTIAGNSFWDFGEDTTAGVRFESTAQYCTLSGGYYGDDTWYTDATDAIYSSGGHTYNTKIGAPGLVGPLATVVAGTTANAPGLPDISGTPSKHLFNIRSNSGANVYMGLSPASPFAGWIQVCYYNDASVHYPFVVNPNGGALGVGTNEPTFVGTFAKAIGAGNYDGLRIVDTGYLVDSYATLDFFNAHASYNASIARLFTQIGAAGEAPVFTIAVADAAKTLQNRIVIDKDGNMGQGVAIPLAQLHVANSIAISNATEGNTGRLTRRCARELVTLSGATKATTLNIPSGARLLAVQMCVNTAVTDDGGDDTWSAAFSGGSTTAIVSGAAAAKQTKVNLQIVDEIANNTTNITFTPNGGEFSAGVIEVLVYYEELTAMANAA